MSDHFEREKEIFCGALELGSSEERQAYIRGACGNDDPLRQAVESLLEAHLQDGGFIPHRVTDPSVFPDETPLGETPGTMVGRYKLLQQIGEGGCGVVYMAEQEEPVRRKVALKLIRAGMDTRSVMARFEAERQALALMDHPNIARVFDAGATEMGRPYFVMELVRGMKITEYCDQTMLSVTARSNLFIQVCQAVQHAHQKGIIHRDLKPSNILVTVNDGVAVPKVIDFGIAKATDGQQLTNKTVFTAFEQFVGTPAYMSPEQTELTSLDVDTRSDIYTLGVLFYEMLTGKTPFDSKELMEAGLDEMRRTIREKEPRPPSTRLSAMLGNELSTTAQRRSAGALRLVSELRGDLDWIVMKALEKERQRRYQSAAELAADVRRHLENEPVEARPPSQIYRLGKWARKNRLVVAAGTAVALAILSGLVISVWQWRVARASEKAARAEAAKSDQVARFLKQMLKGVGPAVAKGRDTKLLREILDKTAADVGKDLNAQPDVEAELRSTLGGVYAALGDYGAAEAMDRAALSLRRQSGPESLKVADSLNDLANVCYRQGKLTNAETMHRDALAIRRKLLGNKHSQIADSLSNLANVLREQSKFREAEAMHREALAIRRELLGTNHADTAASLDNLAVVLSLENNSVESIAMERESLEMTKRALGNEHPEAAISLNNLADMLLNAGNLAEAEATNRAALALRIKLFGTNHPDVAFSLFNLANVLEAEGRLPEAEDMHRQALEMRKKLLGNEHPDVAGSLNNLAGVLIDEGKFSEAETAQREALDIQRKILPVEHQDIAGSLDNIAKILWFQGRPTEAEATFHNALAMQRKLFGNDHEDIALTLHDLANVLASEERLPEAESMHRDALAMRKKLLGDDHPAVAESLSDLAGVLEREGKLPEAEAACRNAVVLREKILPDNWLTFDARSQLGGILSVQKKFADAEPLLLSGYEGMKLHQAMIPAPNQSRIKDAIQRLVSHYKAAHQPDKAAEWRKKFDASH